ncbi:MAG: ANTAR domain-containing protein [Clostridiaceae bacterium]|nr:ANTAR domain-containing protein [Clostridiaceae bacterium]
MRHLIIAFSDQEVARKIKTFLSSQGFPVAGTAGSGAQVLQQASMLEGGGVVICPYRFLDMTAQEIMRLLPDEYDMLVLVAPRQQGMIGEPGIYTLTQPVNGPTLLESARQLLDTRQMRTPSPASSGRPRLKPDAGGSGIHQVHERSMEDQKIIEQAKYLLMNRRQWTENEAHRYLQKRSMETGIRLVDLAKQLIMPD